MLTTLIPMKTILFLSVFSLVLFSCENSTTEKEAEDTEQSTSEQDYKDMAQDACDCVNNATAQLSPRMQKILNEFDGDEEKMKQLMVDYTIDDQTAALEDAQKFQGPVIIDFTTCLDGVQKKYDDKFTTDSDDEIKQKMVDILKELEGCSSSYGMVKMAIRK